MQSMQTIIDDFYTQTCKQYTTYETVITKEFSLLMDRRFDPTTQQDAFTYARDRYGYMTASEIAAMDAENSSNDICGHGLTVWTCPCGCFEGD